MELLDLKNDKNILSRLHTLLVTSGLTKSEFAKMINSTHQSFNKYLNDVNDIQKLSLALFRKGYSVHWLYSGKGNPLLEIAEDNGLSQIIKSYDYRIQNKRIEDWINRHYENVIEYEIARDFKRSEIQRIFDEDLDIPYLILKRIENSGCNLHWSLTGEGSQYADNLVGNKLNQEIK